MYIADAGKYALIGAMLAFVVCHLKHRVLKTMENKSIVKILFFAYICAVLSQTIFPEIDIGVLSNTGMPYIDIYLDNNIDPSINLIPFKDLYGYIINILEADKEMKHIAELNVLGNILMFIPLGLLLPMVYEKAKKTYMVILISSIFSLCIEITQLFLNRCFDVDDLILNIVGSAIGYIIFKTIRFIIMWRFPGSSKFL